MAPKFSVIVPVYNVEEYLAQCLDSLLNQTYQDFELVVVDDVSKDSSLQIAREYAQKHPRIRLVEHEVNKGLGGARNTGIEKAEGEYLIFLDSDDYLREDSLELIHQQITQKNADIVEYCFFWVDEMGRSLNRRTYSEETVPSNLLRTVSACNKAFRRNLFEGIRFPEKRYYEDFCTIPKLLAVAGTVAALNEPLYMYRQRTTSIIHDTNAGKNLDIIWGADQLLAFFRERKLPEQTRTGLEYLVTYHVMYHAVLRVNGIDRHSALQNTLVSYVRENFPDYRQNPYREILRPRERKLLALIEKEKWGALYLRYHMRNRITGGIKRFLRNLKGK